MGYLALFISIICIGLSYDIATANLFSPQNARIVGGEIAEIETYPYTASIILTNATTEFICGGTIVTERHILTAGHCLRGMQNATARIGSTYSDRDGQTYSSRFFNTHFNFNPENYDFDIGVIQFSQPMDIDNVTSAIVDLPPLKKKNSIPEGTPLNVTGWGYLTEVGPGTDTLNVVEVPSIRNPDCEEQLGIELTNRMFCAGYDEGLRDNCLGDGGGPAVNNNRLLGIVSAGFGCGRPNSPGVYTNITDRSIRSWIERYTGR